jgi:predicted MPP superfamily phosphohydrolase
MLYLVAVLINVLAYLAMRRAVKTLLRPIRQRPVLIVLAAIVLLLNLPLLFLFDRQAGGFLYSLSPEVLQAIFLPTSVWMMTLIIFMLIAVPVGVVVYIMKHILVVAHRITRRDVSDCSGNPVSPVSSQGLSRRELIAGGGGLLIPAVIGMTSYKAYSSMDSIDITPERPIQIPYLPKSMEGLRVVQISDIHVGPYIGEEILQHVVHLINELSPDLVFITGDIIDRSLSDLPKALRGMKGIHASQGTYAVLGNHDISSDAYSRSGDHLGGVKIAEAFDSIGIQTLRNEVAYIGSGSDRLALLGLDWLSQPGDRRFYSYRQSETRSQLHNMMEQISAATPTILLAHHPDTFEEAEALGIGLTLAGHSHGGQIVLANIENHPIALASLRFRYVSGLYQVNSSSLYVNRGIGYFGVPVRINCRQEISCFKLVGNHSGTKHSGS